MEHMKHVNCVAALSLALLLLGGAAHATPVVYRNPADGRAWEVVMDAAEPLVWQWAEGAVSATVTVSNVLSGAKSETNVARGELLDGSYVLPQSGADEQLFDVTLAHRICSGQVCRPKHACRRDGRSGRPHRRNVPRHAFATRAERPRPALLRAGADQCSSR